MELNGMEELSMEIDAGDVVWGFWPYDGDGGKNRPLLVLSIDESTGRLELVYGSSQHVCEVRPSESAIKSEFLVTQSGEMAIAGLSKPTRFDLKKRMLASSDGYSVIGHVRASAMLCRIGKAAKAADLY
jgi:hypothetical protein